MRALARFTPVVILAAVALAGCGDSSSGSSSAGSTGAGSASGSGSGPVASGSLTVLAAASLRDVFAKLGDQFEADHPGSTVEFSFGPSSGLATQIVEGAPADVFASASAKTMKTAEDAGAVNAPVTFATNSMTIVVPKDNPGTVDDVSDLASKDTTVAVCAKDVPCGAAALTVFEQADLDVTPVSEEVDVAAVLTKVSLGEVDAGLVYVTDTALARDKVTQITLPADVSATTDYPIAVTTESANPALAQQFVDLVTGTIGQDALKAAGFAPAP